MRSTVPKSQFLIAMGSNQRHGKFGSPVQIVKEALLHLDRIGLSITAVSKIMQSRPVGPSIRNYANAAAIIESHLKPLELLAELKHIESVFGKRRGQRWSRRILDLDIILKPQGAFHSASPYLCIPHPLAYRRDFVLRPAAQIAADWRDPMSGLTIRHLLWRLNRPKPLDPNQKHH